MRKELTLKEITARSGAKIYNVPVVRNGYSLEAVHPHIFIHQVYLLIDQNYTFHT
jgi:hypothetical protein